MDKQEYIEEAKELADNTKDDIKAAKRLADTCLLILWMYGIISDEEYLAKAKNYDIAEMIVTHYDHKHKFPEDFFSERKLTLVSSRE